MLYLGEINDSQQAAWRKTLEVFDEEQQQCDDAEPVSAKTGFCRAMRSTRFR